MKRVLSKSGSKTEAAIQKEILEYLHSDLVREHVYAWRSNSMGVYDPLNKVFRASRGQGYIKGVADILGVIGLSGCDKDGLIGKGRFLAIEVKSVTGRLTQDQSSFLLQINNRGGLGVLARSVEDVQRAFEMEGVFG